MSPTLGVEDGRVADERAAVDRHEAELRLEVDDELAIGRLLVRPEDREGAVDAAADRVHHRRRVVVVGPDAGRVGAGDEPVGERLPGLTFAPGPEKPGM